jgi:hypothetical protein
MKPWRWSEEKNAWLKEVRGLCFEEVVMAIANGDLIDIVENASSAHSDQRCFVVLLDDYPHVVPFVESRDQIFLKTIFPSRRYKAWRKKQKKR